jgi:tetratricopeptide (TPR) repeat protein
LTVRFLASIQNSKGIELEEKGDISGAIAAYRRALKWDRKWSVPWYNLGLLFKRLHDWRESLEHNEKAVELNPSDEAAWWNLGIAATALGRWSRARDAWRACGIDVPDGNGPVEMELGPVPIRLNPDSEAEVVWCKRIDPARAIVWNVPLPESGHRCGDLVLHDGARNGTRGSDGVEVPVFDELVLLQPSSLGTFVVTITGLTSFEAEQLVEEAAEHQLKIEDWSTQIQWLCRACSAGTIEHAHDDTVSETERRFGVAASSEAAVRRFIAKKLELSPGATLHALECAIEPTPVQ